MDPSYLSSLNINTLCLLINTTTDYSDIVELMTSASQMKSPFDMIANIKACVLRIIRHSRPDKYILNVPILFNFPNLQEVYVQLNGTIEEMRLLARHPKLQTFRIGVDV